MLRYSINNSHKQLTGKTLPDCGTFSPLKKKVPLKFHCPFHSGAVTIPVIKMTDRHKQHPSVSLLLTLGGTSSLSDLDQAFGLGSGTSALESEL